MLVHSFVVSSPLVSSVVFAVGGLWFCLLRFVSWVDRSCFCEDFLEIQKIWSWHRSDRGLRSRVMAPRRGAPEGAVGTLSAPAKGCWSKTDLEAQLNGPLGLKVKISISFFHSSQILYFFQFLKFSVRRPHEARNFANIEISDFYFKKVSWMLILAAEFFRWQRWSQVAMFKISIFECETVLYAF
jgi:hypothetical protein